jgi:hypothetical protein
VLHQCSERHIVPPFYADEMLGTHILRGENIVLMGTLRTRELKGMQATSVDDIKRRMEEEKKKGGGEEMRIKEEDDDFAIY